MRDSMPTYDERLQSTLERIGVQTPPGFEDIEQVRIFKDESVIQFLNPKVEAHIQANTWVVSGSPQVTNFHDILPGFLNKLEPEYSANLKKLLEQLKKQKIGTDLATAQDDDNEVSERVAGETCETAADEDQKS